MIKSHSFDTLSSKVCACGKPLKLRLVQEKSTYKKCYKCYKKSEARRGHTIDTQPRKSRIAAGLSVKSY